MPFKWIIKRYKEDPIKVSEFVGRQALAAWEQGTPVIKLPNDMSISSSTISAIEPTYEAEEDDIYKLASGLKREVVVDLEGNVLTNWFKRNVGDNAWEKYYAPRPHYYKLVGEDKTVWAAMRLPMYTNDLTRSEELIPCSEVECNLLDRIGNDS